MSARCACAAAAGARLPRRRPAAAWTRGMDLFPTLDPSKIYINAASRTPLPSRTLAVGLAAVKRKAESPWSIGDTEKQKDEVRAIFARLIGGGATADDICCVPSCSYAMSLAAQNFRSTLRKRPRDRRQALVLQDQNPSNVMQWQQLCEDEDGELRVVPPPADGDWAQAVCACLADGRVAVCALPPCHWCDGALVDLPPIGAACKAHGVEFVVDATQWLGAGPPLDLPSIGACFVACSIHKWLLGPYGACLCYTSPSFWKRAAPLEQHDRNREGAQHVECLPMDHTDGGYPTAFQHGARRLDSGGRPSFIVMPMLLQSLKLLVEDIGIHRLSAWLAGYTAAIAFAATALGFSVPRHHAPGILGLRPASSMPDAATIVEQLGKRQPKPVLVSERLGAIRVSPHLYNTREDLIALIEGLKEAVGQAGAEVVVPLVAPFATAGASRL